MKENKYRYYDVEKGTYHKVSKNKLLFLNIVDCSILFLKMFLCLLLFILMFNVIKIRYINLYKI